ncbi:hypothetical protein BH09BAC5_BH09BAC5_25510 [soil metagenome]
MSFTNWMKDIGGQISERIRTPLYSTFVLAWATSNWKAIYITIFENITTLGQSKITYLTSVLYPENSCSTYLKLIVYPSVATGVIIWILPRLVHIAFVQTEKFRDKRRIDKLQILKESVVPGEQYIALREKYKEQLDSYSSSIRDISANETKISELEVGSSVLKVEIQAKEQMLIKAELDSKVFTSELNLSNTKYLKTKHCAEDIFGGHWINYFSIPNKMPSHEYFSVKQGYQYWIYENARFEKGVYTFDIDRFIYDKNDGVITFRKIDQTKEKREPVDVLLKIDFNEKDWNGFENDNIPVKYSKNLLIEEKK